MELYDEPEESLDERIERLKREKDEAFKATMSDLFDSDAMERFFALSNEYIQALDSKSAELDRSFREAKRRLEEERVIRAEQDALYERPDKGISGFFSRWLGPLPAKARKVDLSDDSLASLPNYRLMGLAMVCAAIGLIITLALTVPWLVVSPAIMLYRLFVPTFGIYGGVALTVISTIVLMSFASHGYAIPSYEKGSLLDKAAASEEQWFRMGAESWSFGQRIVSCVSFGFMHIINIIYPITNLMVLSLMGAVLMAVYLKEYRRSNNTERAVLAATKLHAAYNRFAIAYLAVAASTAVIVSVFL